MRYVSLLPFMDSEELKELANQIIKGEVEGVNIVVLYPFLNNEDLEEIVDQLIELNEGKKLTSALPFVSNKTVEKIYQKIQDGTLTGVNENALLPFLPKSKIKEMFYDLVKKAKENTDNSSDEE